MPVDRAFTIKGTGTVVTGTVWTGSIGRDSSVIVFPPGKRSRVRGIQHHGADVRRADPGERVALALTDLDVAEVSRGSVVIADDSWLPSSRVEAEITISDDSVAIGPRTRLRFHLGTSDVGARISGSAQSAHADGSAFVATIVLDEPLLMRGGDRFVIRLPSPAITIGGGRVRDPYPGSPRSALIRSMNRAPKRLREWRPALVSMVLRSRLCRSGWGQHLPKRPS
jgi:selenocysteine-specific elongation factor